ncbi:MAG: hypothetical protein IJC26_00575, partial [Clostridia bacterium]|nr:hypothetical protein [Clostridia bacterium]
KNGFTRAWEGAKKLQTLPSVLDLRCTVVRENAGDLEELERLCEKQFGLPVAHAKEVFNRVRGGCMPVAESRLEPEEMVELILSRSAKRIRERIPENRRDRVEICLSEPTDFCEVKEGCSLLGCSAGMEHFTLTYDGRLLGCQLLENFSTDAVKLGFAQAWEQFPFQVRLPEVSAECAQCDQIEFCTVCPAVRMAECGNLYDRPHYVCRMTKNLAKRIGETL